MTRHRNIGLRKICDCSRRTWAKCPHSWHFNFKWGAVAYRFSLDRHAGKHIDSKTDAETLADKIRTDIREGRFRFSQPATPESASLTVAQLLELYAGRHLEPAKGKPTADASRQSARVIGRTPVLALGAALVPFGDWRVSEVTTEALEGFRDTRRQSGMVAANRDLALLSAAFSWGASKKRKLVADNPFRDGDKSAVARFEERNRTRRLHPGEADRLLAACGDHLRAIVECALETGMRRGEILSLQWHQVRWAPKAEISLPAGKTKTKRDRRVAMSTRLGAVLEMRRQDPSGDEHPPDAYVFGTTTGERCLSFKRAWQTAVLKAHGHKATYAKGANLSKASRAVLRTIDLHFHDLRREAGSRWLDWGVPLSQIQVWLGHTTAAQTCTYLAVTDQGGEMAMKRAELIREQLEAATCNALQQGPKEGANVGLDRPS